MIEKLSKDKDLPYAYTSLGAAVGVIARKIDEIIEEVNKLKEEMDRIRPKIRPF
jgi:hypothetical protein